MKSSLQIFIDIIKLSLWDNSFDEVPLASLSEDDWNELFTIAQLQGLAAVFIAGLDKLSHKSPTCKAFIEEYGVITIIGSERRWQRQHNTAKKISDAFQANGISTLLLKGLGLSLCYPNSQYRECNDIDIYLFGKYEEGNQLAEQLFNAKVDKFTKKEDHVFLDGFTIDNHICFIWPVTDNDREFDQYLKGLLRKEELSQFPDTCILLPPPDFNYLFLMSHSFGHFMREGMALRQMTDIACFLKSNEKYLDWEVINDKLNRYHLRKFSDAILSFIEHYFGLSFAYKPTSDTQLLERMMKDILTHSHAVFYPKSKLEARVYLAKTALTYRWRYDAFYEGGFIRYVLDKFMNKVSKLFN